LEYDDVFNKQRTAFYNRRMELLKLTEEKKLPEKILPELSEKLISLSEFWLNTDQDTFYHNLSNILPDPTKEEADELFVEDPDIRSKQIKEMFEKRYEVWHKSLDEKTINEVLKSLTLRIIDTMWMDHLEEMEYLRDSVNLRAYGQKDPLVEYKQESYRLYKNLEENYLVSLLNILFKVEVKQNNVENVSKKKEIDPYSHQNVGRNDLCPCGSGKKYKRCHGA
jgi:preprotein translocase subunit SecA